MNLNHTYFTLLEQFQQLQRELLPLFCLYKTKGRKYCM